MGTRTFGGQSVVPLLLAILVGIAVLPLPSCVGGGGYTPPPPDYYKLCGKDLAVDWSKVLVLGTYASVGKYAPVSGSVGAPVPPNTHVSGNSFGGSLKSPSTNVMYLVESHPSYTVDEIVVKKPVDISGLSINLSGNAGQSVTLEYLDNGRTIYVTMLYLVKPKGDSGDYEYKYKTYYHRIHCGHGGSISAGAVQDGLFTSIDAILGRGFCKVDGSDYSDGLYESRRGEFIEKVVASACGSNKIVGAARPIFDCIKAFDIAQDWALAGEQYADILHDNGDVSVRNPYTYTCPHRSIYTKSKSSYEPHVRLKEYYVDPVHPLVVHNVVTYELDPGKGMMTAKVYSASGGVVLAHDGLYPSQRGVEKIDGAGGMSKLDDCGVRSILNVITLTDEKYRRPVHHFEFIGTKYNETGAGDLLIKHDPMVYDQLRRKFVRDLVYECATGNLISEVIEHQKCQISNNTAPGCTMA